MFLDGSTTAVFSTLQNGKAGKAVGKTVGAEGDTEDGTDDIVTDVSWDNASVCVEDVDCEEAMFAAGALDAEWVPLLPHSMHDECSEQMELSLDV